MYASDLELFSMKVEKTNIENYFKSCNSWTNLNFFDTLKFIK